MGYESVKAKFLPSGTIRKEADRIRKENNISSVPINVELLLEKLGVFIEAKALLFQRAGAEALITANWDIVYVDSEKYMDDKYVNRLRFSLAHELGHMILHRQLFDSFGIKNEKMYREFFDQIPELQYKKIETQANMFANNFLVPRDILEEKKKAVIDKHQLGNISEERIRPYLPNILCGEFGVSDDVIAIALDHC